MFHNMKSLFNVYVGYAPMRVGLENAWSKYILKFINLKNIVLQLAIENVLIVCQGSHSHII